MASLLNLSGSALMNKVAPRDYSLEYFTIESLADGNTVSIKNVSCNTLPTFYYSTDNGTTWSSITAEKGKTKSVATIDAGDKVMFKSTNQAISTRYDQYNCFLASKNHIAYGNVMSLLYGDLYIGQTQFASGSSQNLDGLFKGDAYLTDAGNLILPATVLAESCYNGFFRDCVGLARSPELPALILAKSCYASMFEGCVNLEGAPELPFTQDADSCCQRMFQMNRSSKVTSKMTKSPVIRVSVMHTNCFNNMFNGNGSLVEVTCLATEIQSNAAQTWLGNVSSTGTFRKAAGVTWPSGTSGIPSGWTVQDYTE